MVMCFVLIILLASFGGLLGCYRTSFREVNAAIDQHDTALLQQLCQEPFVDLDGKRPVQDAVVTIMDGVPEELPLMKAIRSGDLEIVQILVENGADVNYRRPYEKNYYMDYAISWGKADILELLLEENAKSRGEYYGLVNLARSVQKGFFTINDFISTYSVLMKYSRLFYENSEKLWDGLCVNLCADALNWCLDNGDVDINYRFSDNSTFLHNCISNGASEEKIIAFADFLISKGIEVSSLDENGKTAQIIAEEKGYSRLSEHLLNIAGWGTHSIN